MKIIISLILLASGLFYYPLFIEEFEQPKAFAFIAFGCFAAFWVKWRRIFTDKIALSLFLFTASAAVSAYFSIDWHMSIFGNIKCPAGLLVIASYLIFYLVVSEHITEKIEAQKIIDILLGCATVIVIYAIAQVLGYDFKQWTGTLKEAEYTRPMSTLGHPNFMANYLAMILPFGIWRMENSSKNYQKFIYVLILLLMAAAIFLSLSRGMLIAVIAGIFVYFLHSKIKIKNISYSFLIITGIFISLLVTFPTFKKTALNRLPSIINPEHVRMEYPLAAIKIWQRYPWFGIGTDAYELGFQHQRSALYWKIQAGGSPHKAHNDFMNILATQGIFGAMVAIILTIFIGIRASRSKSIFAAPAISSIVVFYVAGLTSFTVITTGTLLLFCITVLNIKRTLK